MYSLGRQMSETYILLWCPKCQAKQNFMCGMSLTVGCCDVCEYEFTNESQRRQLEKALTDREARESFVYSFMEV